MEHPMLDNKTIQANLVGLLASRGDSGPLWATESDDLDCTFVSWENGQGVVAHVNSEVDVMMIVLSGYGKAIIDGDEVGGGCVVDIPFQGLRHVLFEDEYPATNLEGDSAEVGRYRDGQDQRIGHGGAHKAQSTDAENPC